MKLNIFSQRTGRQIGTMHGEIEHFMDPKAIEARMGMDCLELYKEVSEDLAFNKVRNSLSSDINFNSDPVDITLEGFLALRDAITAVVNKHWYTKEKE